MIGDVFYYEARRVCRPSRLLYLRGLYVLLLLAEFLFFVFSWSTRAFWNSYPGLDAAEAVWGYFEIFAAQHFLLILLTTPALAAGSIADEKTTGTLDLILTTQLNTAEIILGKWISYVFQSLLLTLPVAPILVVLSVLGGLHPSALVAWLVETLVLILALTAAALLGSVWARRTSSAVLGVYLAGAALLLGLGLAGFGNVLDRLSPLQPQNQLAGDAAVSLALLVTLAACTALCLALAVWRLRPAHLAQQISAARAGRLARWLQRPAVGNVPLRWKERYTGELGLLSFLRRVPRRARLGGVALLGFLAGMSVHESWTLVNYTSVLWHGLALLFGTGVIVAVRASGVISGEREKQTWEGLLLTPLDSYQLVRSKLWGVIDSVRPYLLAYLLPALGWAIVDGIWPTFCLVYCWLATWALLYYMGATGLDCSAHAASSWRSLLRTLVSAAARALTRWLPLLALGAVVALMVSGALSLLPWISSEIRFCIYLAVCVSIPLLDLFGEAEVRLQKAQDHIERRERGGKVEVSTASLAVRFAERARREREAASGVTSSG